MDAVEVRSAADVEQLTPDERQRLVNERTAIDLADVPEGFLTKARAEGRRLLVEHHILDVDQP